MMQGYRCHDVEDRGSGDVGSVAIVMWSVW